MYIADPTGIFDMITYTQGNLLESNAQALVNTVNTVGVMGKGIALMFKQQFPENFKRYAKACKSGDVKVGEMFVVEVSTSSTQHSQLQAQPHHKQRWIVNFPTKQHWRTKSKIEWIQAGLQNLRQWLIDNHVESIAIPPLGAGNGGLPWQQVKPLIEQALGDLLNIDIQIFEPSDSYHSVATAPTTDSLTHARALLYQVIDRYWVLGMECSLLEVHKLMWFLQRAIERHRLVNPLQLSFMPHYYGTYAPNLRHLLNHLDGSYLLAEKRLPDCKPLDVIWANQTKQAEVEQYLQTSMSDFLPVLIEVDKVIAGFESPFGLELLSTVDWLIYQEQYPATVEGVRQGMANWSAGEVWAKRKLNLFNVQHIDFALQHLKTIY